VPIMRPIPDWVTKSTLAELDHTVNRLFGDWQKLYEAFRRTDNVLTQDEYCVSKVKLGRLAAELIINGYGLLQPVSSLEKYWDEYYKLWKNPDNRIPVWRD
ncbi:MAG: hypothetical protein KJ971_08645, partial [Firmicutes bacterium]|nr:hypothetical protein [Bacillota bacterium]